MTVRIRPHCCCAGRILLALFFGLGGVQTRAEARPTFRSDPTYLIDTWETEDGLPENSATAMVQTADGYLWFGTFGGLVRFDGVKFTVLNAFNTPGLPNSGVVNLHLDWQDMENRRTAHFYDLAPRDYLFRVRAANNDGVGMRRGRVWRLLCNRLTGRPCGSGLE
jgi:hypothetical protein